MLKIESVNHIGIRIREKETSLKFYEVLGFEYLSDAGFEDGHPIILKHPSGVVLNLLGPANIDENSNILMDVEEKYTGITHFALTVESLEDAKTFLADKAIKITGSFSFGNMSAIFIRDPDRNVIELDAYGTGDSGGSDNYVDHP